MATPFRPAFDLLVQYAAYHRDRRNIATHFIGVPLIVFAVSLLLGRPGFAIAGLWLTPAWIVFAPAALWYVTRGEFGLGIAVSAAIAVLVLLAQQVVGSGLASPLGWGLGLFVVGWMIQLAGHYYEGRKPALADDLVGLLVGPMFVALELLSQAGMFKSLVQRIDGRAGPTFLRDLAHPAT
ncbi:MAG: DUF962 domain-containing protein [Burkholderiales bacterium]|nr:DUF962 domain-containing protein [Burkholderiales bacterium]MDE2457419.1 DUF962 domain-containing protein [Burkholderiales bacterium]